MTCSDCITPQFYSVSVNNLLCHTLSHILGLKKKVNKIDTDFFPEGDQSSVEVKETSRWIYCNRFECVGGDILYDCSNGIEGWKK